MRWILLCLLVLLLVSVLVPTVALPDGPATTQRPISDFLDAQCGFYRSPCCQFGGVFCGIDPARGTVFDVIVDLFNLYGLPGTTTSGTVTERPLADGRAEVTVVLHTRHALTFVWPTGSNPLEGAPVLFGATPCALEWCPPAATPAWGDVEYRVVFINPRPGDPLPSSAQLCNCPVSGQQWLNSEITVRAFGPLHSELGVPEGTPGMLYAQGKFVAGVGPWPTPGWCVPRSQNHAVPGWCPSTFRVLLRPVGSGAGN